MADVRNDKLTYIQGDGFITILKGGLYICEVRNSAKFNEILIGNFNPTVGLTSDTIIEIGEYVKTFCRGIE